MSVWKLDAVEADVLCRAFEAGAFDELLVAFYASDINTEAERACERALDEAGSHILGRRVRVWACKSNTEAGDHARRVWATGHSRIEKVDGGGA